MSDTESVDVATTGYLLTTHPPEYALFVIFSPLENDHVHVIRQTSLLPVLPIPQHQPFIITPTEISTHLTHLSHRPHGTHGIHGTLYQMYQVRVREYVNQALKVMFDQVTYVNIEYTRAPFSSNILVLEIQIKNDFILNPKERDLNVITSSSLQEPYDDTVSYLMRADN